VDVDDEDVEQYDGEFDDDGLVEAATAAAAETVESPGAPPPADLELGTEVEHEDEEGYDAEFDDDDPPPVVEPRSPAKKEEDQEDGATSEQTTPVVADAASAVPHEANEVTGDVVDVPDTEPSLRDSTADSENEYSNDSEPDNAVPSPDTASLLSNDNAVKPRRASVPASVIASISEYAAPKRIFARAGSMPMVLPATSLDKWRDSIPQELSPERHDRPRMQSVCLPVLEETQAQSGADDESAAGDSEDGEDIGDTDSPPIPTSRVRAQSYQDLKREKTAVPIRRAQSLLYSGSLPSVKEVHAATDGIVEAATSHENEDSYGDEDNYDDGSEDEDEPVEAQPAHVERPKSGPSSIMHEISTSAPMHSTPTDRFPEAVRTAAGDCDPDQAESTTLDEQGAHKTDTDLSSPNKSDEDYADEMEDAYPSEDDAPQFEGEDTAHKSGDEASDYDVDEFIEEGRRETETLLQEAHALLELEQTAREPHDEPTNQRISEPSATSTEVGIPSPEVLVQNSVNKENSDDSGKYTKTPYDDDDEFGDNEAEVAFQETPEQDRPDQNDGMGQYAFDAREFEDEVHAPEDPLVSAPVENSDVAADAVVQQNLETPGSLQAPTEVARAVNCGTKMENEAPEVLSSGDPVGVVGDTNAQALPVQNPQPAELSSTPNATKQQQEKKAPSSLKEISKPSQPEKGQVALRPVRPKQPVKTVDPAPKQASPPVKPSRPAANRARPVPPSAPPSSSAAKKPTAIPRSSASKMRILKPEQPPPTAPPTVLSDSTSGVTTTLNSSPRKQGSPSKPSQKVSSPRSPSKSHSGPYQYLSSEYPQLPRKESVPRQKASSKPSTGGEHGAKRRLLQPVRTPANLRFDLPKVDKTKRDWLFANMFRHGDDLSKYEAFVPPTLLARPPATKETKKRPLSARQVHGSPPASRFVSPGRKLVVQPSPEMQDRERNWVATTPHDSKLPAYDSILDKYCTTVTSPVVQRQIYQTRHRDLSPQLAFVLEKRVEKQCRNGFYDSFGGVSSSYKTEIVPTSPGDGPRPRQMSPRSPPKSELAQRHAAASSMTASDE